MSVAMAALYALALVGAIFAIAAIVEWRGRFTSRRPALRHFAYTLALGVYCSSWTFYGAVGSAVREGWDYLPIYLAPVCLLVAAPQFLKRLSQAVADEQAATISDFIAARFGHDVVVARLVTAIALLGTIPYVALQLRSIGNALSAVSGQDMALVAMTVSAVLLALFAILFGARRFELSGRSEGLVFAIGLESVIKIAALTVVGMLAISLIIGMGTKIAAFGAVGAIDLQSGVDLVAARFQPERLSLDTGIIFLISVMAVVVLPRQFYMGLVEARDPSDFVRARWGLALYIVVMALVVLPIAVAGAAAFGTTVGPDLYVLNLPEQSGSDWILAAAMLGGVSAAASMVIVDSTALATMVSNDLIFPSVIRATDRLDSGSLGRRMLLVRRLSIIAIILVALAWALLVSPGNSLASIGLVAFAAMAQFTPHLILAVQSGGRDPVAARVSMTAGLVLWLYTLALPPVLPQAVLDHLRGGLFDPLRLFGIGDASPLVHGVLWSLGANLAVYLFVAARRSEGPVLPRLMRMGRPVTDLLDLANLTASFIGEERARAEFPEVRRGTPVDRKSAQRAQELIARVVGASSARSLVATALAGGQMALSDVARLLDEGGQSLRFSRQLLAATFENVDAGISVVDADMNLMAWNTRYLEIFDYPPGLVRVGVPVADLIRHNALRGDFGEGDVEFHIAKRLGHMQRGQRHSFERRRRDGRVIQTVGGPMPGGGYVTSFTDVTEEVRIRDELERTLAELETRVADRTSELSAANQQLARATRDKTRFLAAASHDLLQPLHAARLFTAALERDIARQQPGEGTASPRQDLVKRVERSILAAEDLLRALLDISKLDAGGVQPQEETVALAPFLRDLAEGIRPVAQAKGLDMRLGTLCGIVQTDPALLRSVIQNFLTNAVRYTPTGGLLLGVRRRGSMLRIDVIDTGIGIAEEQRQAIFTEFTRLGELEAEGLGLGLAIADRIVRLLGGTIELASTPGKGSRFSLLLPEARKQAAAPAEVAAIAPVLAPTVSIHVLVVDNDPQIVEATMTLLHSYGHQARGAATIAQAVSRAAGADLVLADFRLDNGESGLDLIAMLRTSRPDLRAVLITAERDADLVQRAAELAVPVLFKPVAPEQLEALLASVAHATRE